MYTWVVDVAMSTFRAEMASWMDRVRDGEELVITDRGTPVARLVPVGSISLIESLTEKGLLSRPGGPRPVARDEVRVHADGSVSVYVTNQRR
jgi:prevent-host-death family protein